MGKSSTLWLLLILEASEAELILDVFECVPLSRDFEAAPRFRSCEQAAGQQSSGILQGLRRLRLHRHNLTHVEPQAKLHVSLLFSAGPPRVL